MNFQFGREQMMISNSEQPMTRFIHIIMLMTQLRELSEYWTKCRTDLDGVPVEIDEPKIEII